MGDEPQCSFCVALCCYVYWQARPSQSGRRLASFTSSLFLIINYKFYQFHTLFKIDRLYARNDETYFTRHRPFTNKFRQSKIEM